jgi:hypothetical protein
VIVPVLTVVAGVVVLALGIRLVRRHWSAYRARGEHADGHGHVEPGLDELSRTTSR